MRSKPFLPGLAAATIFVAVLMFAGAAFGQPQNTWEFKVRLDGKVIGDHIFTVNDSGPLTTVKSDASFDVRFLFVTALKYRHSAVETWQENCLSSIDARTISNRKEQHVSGSRKADRLAITSMSGAATFTDCVKTFAYWNPDILDAQALLNSQTGDYVDVEVTPLGDDILTVGSRDIRAQKFALRSTTGAAGKPVNVKLWYSADTRQWLALESKVAGNRVLRYEPVRLPDNTRMRSAAVPRQDNFYEEQR